MEFSSTSPETPDTTCSPLWATVTTQLRVWEPCRWNECGPSRSQPYDSMVIVAPCTCDWVDTKCRASSSPNDSGSPTPYCFANAYTVFFIVSVGSTPLLSPV